MGVEGPRILVIGGTYRAMCVLERLLERGDRVAAFIGLEGGAERDFCPEILELCDAAAIPARSGHKLGEEIVRWLEDRIRPELAVIVGVDTEVPLAIGGNCRLGLVELIDMFQSKSCPGVILRQRGQDLIRRKLPWPDDPDRLGDAYLHVIDVLVDCVEEYIDGLQQSSGAPPLRVPYRRLARPEDSLAAMVERPEPGEETTQVEREVAEYVGADAVFALRSATDGFRLLAEMLGLEQGCEIVCPGVVSARAIEGLSANGAQPAYADVRVGRLTLDPEQARDAVSDRSRGLLICHALGQPAELDLLYALAEEKSLEVVEDAGDGLGARFFDSRLGRSPCTCVFRLPLGGGAHAALVTLPEKLAERFAPLAAEHRLGDGAAALARAELEGLEERIALRRRNAHAYSSELSRYDAFSVPVTPEDSLPTYAAYLLHVTRFARTPAGDLRKLLGEAGIETRRLRLPLSEHDLTGLPAADHARACGILLPVDAEFGDEQREHVLDAIFGYAIG